MAKSRIWRLFFFFGLPAILIGSSAGHIFFWDTISQGSRLPDFFYQNQFSNLFLPARLDQGHPPLFQWYIAAGWLALGRTLAVSHWLMFPILAGIFWQWSRLVRGVFSPKRAWLGMALLLLDTTFLAQGILVSPDLLLLFAFLLALNGIFERRSGPVIVGTILLGMISIRGIFMVVALFLTALCQHFRTRRRLSSSQIFDIIGPWLPAAIVVSGWLVAHYLEAGWWVSTPNESWGSQRSIASGSQILKNILIGGWRLVDFGKIGVWLVLGLAAYRWWRRWRPGRVIPEKIYLVGVALGAFLVIHFGTMIWFTNPIAHRYFLPAGLLALFLAGWFLTETDLAGRHARSILAGMVILLVSGNFWVYPDRIAQGWDSTLAHIPYYDLREKALDFMEKNNIPPEQTGTEFPNKSPFDELDLSGRKTGMPPKDLATQPYIFYSNIMNDFSDDELRELSQQWRVLFSAGRRGVRVVLYQKPGD